MVELIGVAVIVALSWLLASTMATESDAEKRRLSSVQNSSSAIGETDAKQAA